MYDVCVIGGGIVGKYIVSKLTNKKVAWVSSKHPLYFSPQKYQFASYVGKEDTWQEKATGLISWPSDDDSNEFPIAMNDWKRYQQELKDELNIRSLEGVGKSPKISSIISYLSKEFPKQPIQFFDSAHQTFSGPDFLYREEFDNYWQKQKAKWSFLDARPDYFHAACLNVDKGRAISIHGDNENGKRAVISAKSFIVACHVPGTIQLIQNTYAAHRISAEDKNYLGRNFSEHPQVSLGILCLQQEIPRTTLPAICFQDYERFGFRVRLEFHFAPPKKELIRACLSRLPEFSEEYFQKHFLRIVATIHVPSLPGNRIHFNSFIQNQYKLSSKFWWYLSLQRKILLNFLRENILKKDDFKLLNRHFSWHFAGHMSGGTAYPFVVDDDFFVCPIPNVAIASSSVFPTNGLFNPTMTTLICAKHILKNLPKKL